MNDCQFLTNAWQRRIFFGWSLRILRGAEVDFDWVFFVEVDAFLLSDGISFFCFAGAFLTGGVFVVAAAVGFFLSFLVGALGFEAAVKVDLGCNFFVAEGTSFFFSVGDFFAFLAGGDFVEAASLRFFLSFLAGALGFDVAVDADLGLTFFFVETGVFLVAGGAPFFCSAGDFLAFLPGGDFVEVASFLRFFELVLAGVLGFELAVVEVDLDLDFFVEVGSFFACFSGGDFIVDPFFLS